MKLSNIFFKKKVFAEKIEEESKIKVSRIRNCYVSDKCVQIMLTVNGKLILVGPQGLVYNSDAPSGENLYLADERKNDFPYADIPSHGLDTPQAYNEDPYYKFNALLDFKTPYLVKSDNSFTKHSSFTELLAIKNNDEALLIEKKLSFDDEKDYDFCCEHYLMLNLRGLNNKMSELNAGNNFGVLPNGEVVEKWQNIDKENIEEKFRESMLEHYKNNEVAKIYFKNATLNDDLKLLSEEEKFQIMTDFCEFGFHKGNNGLTAIMVDIVGHRMETDTLDIKVTYKNLLLSKIFEDILTLPNTDIPYLPEPNIDLSINHDITSEQVERAKRLVLEKTNK